MTKAPKPYPMKTKPPLPKIEAGEDEPRCRADPACPDGDDTADEAFPIVYLGGGPRFLLPDGSTKPVLWNSAKGESDDT